MGLTEEQLNRYSRQVLVPGLGGRGQERLLSVGVELLGAGGTALRAAAAYLAAGGTPLANDAILSGAGFCRSNPDSFSPAPEYGCLAEGSVALRGSGPWVLLGEEAGEPLVISRTGAGCEDCFRRTGAHLQPWRGDGATGVALGALAAFAFQRTVLALAEPVAALAIRADGAMGRRAIRVCPKHRLPADLGPVIRHLEAEYPREGCGVILFQAGELSVRPVRNVACDSNRFEFDARDWLEVLRASEACGVSVTCVFHSHCDAAAHFSDADLHSAFPGGELLMPDASGLVVSVERGRTRSARAYWRDDERWASKDCILADL